MITVLIATYNRSKDLKGALECLRQQELEDHLEFEVLIMDNNSSDDTKTVVESFIPGFHGKLKYYFEPTQGKPYALNQGIKAARGDIIVLTDDDCMFENNYLMNTHRIFEEYGQAVGFIGGRIMPRWVNCSKPEWFDHLTPEWFKEHFWGPLAILDYGDEPFIIDHRQVDAHTKKLFYGANMAVRRELFHKHGGFDLQKTLAQDTEIQLRFLKGKEQGLYAPQVKVSHKVTTQRLKPEYFYRWYYLRGLYREIVEQYERKFYHPLGIQYSMIINTLKYCLNSLIERSHIKRIHFRCLTLFNLGQMIQIAKKNVF
jgi:glycosyltransferase involved in cell wall biosynthesis